MTFRLTGLSVVTRKGVGRTVTASTCRASSSSSISMKGMAAETRYSGVVVLLYPMEETVRRQIPGSTRSIRKRPSESVEVPVRSCPASTTAA